MAESCLDQVCTALCSRLSFNSTQYAVAVNSCQAYTNGTVVATPSGQSAATCGTNFTVPADLCRVTLSVKTSPRTTTYMEVWLPDAEQGLWNRRTMSSGNDGLDGCVPYSSMQYTAGRGFVAIGDNAGHNSSRTDGSWLFNSNAGIIDWVYQSRHASLAVGKQVVNQFYGIAPTKSYYIGCSTGGQQGMHAAQYFPDDFDGIIAGSPNADFNHLQDWKSRFIEFTGAANSQSLTLMTGPQWLNVHNEILRQCDKALDGVDDGVLEDPTICHFDSSPLSCYVTNSSDCLSGAQMIAVSNVFASLVDFSNGNFLYPSLAYGAEYDSFRIGLLAGQIQTTVKDWFVTVTRNLGWDPEMVNPSDFALADAQDLVHGNISTFSGNLGKFASLGKKMIIYQGMTDPVASAANAQRYYLKVAHTMGLNYSQIDPFMRLFRISGMGHCGQGGITGDGAWMLGQSQEAASGVDNIIDRLVAWVENDNAPNVITGTRLVNNTPGNPIQFVRPHCRFPFRTTYVGGDSNQASAWNCSLIADWQNCGGPNAYPRLCNSDGSF